VSNLEQVRDQHAQNGPTVVIFLDNNPFTVHRGSISVAELKKLAGIPPTYELEQVEGGKLVPLRDDGRVTLKDNERFISHPRDGASS
jgi:hypothetical protein